MSAFCDWIDSLDLPFIPMPEEWFELEQGMVLRCRSRSVDPRYHLVGYVNTLLGVCDDCRERWESYDAWAWLPFGRLIKITPG